MVGLRRRRRRSCSQRSEKDFQSSDRRWVYAEPEGQKKKVVLLSGQQPSGILTTSGSGKGLQPERAAARQDDVTSDGTKKGVGEPSRWLEGRGSDTGALVCRRKGFTVLQSLRLVLKIRRLLLGNVDQRAGDDDSWKNRGKEFVSTSYLNG